MLTLQGFFTLMCNGNGTFFVQTFSVQESFAVFRKKKCVIISFFRRIVHCFREIFGLLAHKFFKCWILAKKISHFRENGKGILVSALIPLKNEHIL
jgi:hypothetical protein